MKILKHLVGAAVVLAAASYSANAQTVVDGSSHDLAAVGEQICVYCHTPHTGDTSGAPLWNRLTSGATFTMYDSATFDMTAQASPQGVSLACLSCHDGATGYDSVINNTTPALTNTAIMAQPFAIGNTAGSASLTNDHPISMSYVPGDDLQGGLKPVAGLVTAGLPLYGAGSDQVECGTCHNPHNQDGPGAEGKFLRVTVAGSVLCSTCHAK